MGPLFSIYLVEDSNYMILAFYLVNFFPPITFSRTSLSSVIW